MSARSDAACVCMCARGHGNGPFRARFPQLLVPQGCCEAEKIALLAFSNVAERGIGSRGHALAVWPSHSIPTLHRLIPLHVRADVFNLI